MSVEVLTQDLCPFFPERLREWLTGIPDAVKNTVREIRIGCGAAPVLCCGTGRQIKAPFRVSDGETDEIFRKLCSSSPYAYQSQIACGYLTLPGGHRVGLTGRAVRDGDGAVVGMDPVTGFVFRVCRRIFPDPDPILKQMLRGDTIRNTLVCGSPGSGKTTYLRSLAMALGKRYPVVVVDERNEIFPDTSDLPEGCAVLSGYPKGTGMIQALRTLSPRIILCDEVGDTSDAAAMRDGFRSGVAFLCTAHAGSREEIFRRIPLVSLRDSGGFGLFVLLNTDPVGTIRWIGEREENEDFVRGVGTDSGALLRGPLCDTASASPGTVRRNFAADPDPATGDPLFVPATGGDFGERGNGSVDPAAFRNEENGSVRSYFGV